MQGHDIAFPCRDSVLFLCLDNVAMEVSLSRLKQPRQEVRCSTLHAATGQVLCRDKVFLHRDRVWPRQGILGRDIVFSCRDRVWGKGQESLRGDREFDVATELLEIVSRQSIPYVTTGSSRS